MTGLQTIAVMASKGGTGKSTVTVHLAVEAERRGLKAAVADLDRQQSALRWRRARAAGSPEVGVLEPRRLPEFQAHATAAGVQRLFIDTPPDLGAGVVDCVRSAALTLLIVRPAAFDLWAVGEAARLIERFGRPALLVLNQVPTQGAGADGPALQQAMAEAARLGVEIAPIQLSQRKAYGAGIAHGLTAGEVDPACTAATEIAALYDLVEARLAAQPQRPATMTAAAEAAPLLASPEQRLATVEAFSRAQRERRRDGRSVLQQAFARFASRRRS